MVTTLDKGLLDKALLDKALLGTEGLSALARQTPPPTPTPPPEGFAIAAWKPAGPFHRLFTGVLVYESPTERRYFIPHGSRVWNWSDGGWSAWRTRHPSFKRFLAGRWWNETLMGDPVSGRYYDIASPPWFHPQGAVGYVDMFLDVQKRRGRLRVLDQREWAAFLLEHPVDREVAQRVGDATAEASRYGAVAWRNAWDRMEGECRGWVKTQVVEAMRDADVKPAPRVLPPTALKAVLDRVGSTTGKTLAPSQFGKTPAERLPRAIYDHLTAVPAPVAAGRPRRARPRPRR